MAAIKSKHIRYLIAAAAVILDFALVWELFLYFSFPVYLIMPAAVILGFLIKKTTEINNPRLLISCAVFSCLFSVSFVIGGKVVIEKQTVDYLYPADFTYFAALAAVLFFAASWLADLIIRHPIYPNAKRRLSPRKVWVLSSVILFACWICCLLIYYPGNISPDSVECIECAIGRTALSNHQPILYILLMKPFLLFSLAIGKDLEFGVIIFLIFQAAAMAAMLGYLPCWLVKGGCPKWVVIAVMAYFTLDPVFPMYSVTMWKDVLFGGLTMVYVLNLIDIVRSKGELLKNNKMLIWFLILNVLISFIRNNGYYVAAITLVVLSVVFRKSWKRIVPGFLAVLVVVPVIQGPVYDACGVAQSPFAESVGIPLQQIGYTVANNGYITQQQRDFLNQLMPLDKMKKAYTPLSSNGIKFSKDFNNEYLEKNEKGFLKIWAKMLMPNIGSYYNAYLLETVGFWHIGTTNWVLYYGISDSYHLKAEGLLTTAGLVDSDTLQRSRKSMKDNFFNLQARIPFVSNLVSIGALFWAAVFSAFLMFIRKKKKYLLAYLPLLVLWGTLMVATPTFCEFRYMFAFAVAFPIAVILPFSTENPGKAEPGPQRNAS